MAAERDGGTMGFRRQPPTSLGFQSIPRNPQVFSMVDAPQMFSMVEGDADESPRSMAISCSPTGSLLCNAAEYLSDAWLEDIECARDGSSTARSVDVTCSPTGSSLSRATRALLDNLVQEFDCATDEVRSVSVSHSPSGLLLRCVAEDLPETISKEYDDVEERFRKFSECQIGLQQNAQELLDWLASQSAVVRSSPVSECSDETNLSVLSSDCDDDTSQVAEDCLSIFGPDIEECGCSMVSSPHACALRLLASNADDYHACSAASPLQPCVCMSAAIRGSSEIMPCSCLTSSQVSHIADGTTSSPDIVAQIGIMDIASNRSHQGTLETVTVISESRHSINATSDYYSPPMNSPMSEHFRRDACGAKSLHVLLAPNVEEPGLQTIQMGPQPLHHDRAKMSDSFSPREIVRFADASSARPLCPLQFRIPVADLGAAGTGIPTVEAIAAVDVDEKRRIVHGWTAVPTEHGRLFFHNEYRKVSQWAQPLELQALLGDWREIRPSFPGSSSIWRSDLFRISLNKDPRLTTNIFDAALNGNLYFLQLYADVGGCLDVVDPQGRNALHYCCASGAVECALFLLEKGVEVDAPDQNMDRPLHCACRYGQASIAKVLIDAGANLDSARDNGNTPLHDAVDLAQVDCLHLLLLFGADALVANRAGDIPLDLAARKGLRSASELLHVHHRSLPPSQSIPAVLNVSSVAAPCMTVAVCDQGHLVDTSGNFAEASPARRRGLRRSAWMRPLDGRTHSDSADADTASIASSDRQGGVGLIWRGLWQWAFPIHAA